MKKLYLLGLSFALMAMMVSCEDKSNVGGGGGGDGGGGDAPAAKTPVGYWILTDANDQPHEETEMFRDENFDLIEWTHYQIYQFTTSTVTTYSYGGTIVRDTLYAEEPPSQYAQYMNIGLPVQYTFSNGKLSSGFGEVDVQFPDANHMVTTDSKGVKKYYRRIKALRIGATPPDGGDTPAAKTPVGYWILTDANDQPIEMTQQFPDENYNMIDWTFYQLYHFTSTTMTAYSYDGVIVRDTFFAYNPPSSIAQYINIDGASPYSYSNGKLSAGFGEVDVKFPDANHMVVPNNVEGYTYLKRLKAIVTDTNQPGEGGGGGEQGGGSQTVGSIIGTWQCNLSATEYLILTFNSGSSCAYIYVNSDTGEDVSYTGTYTYNTSTCKGRMTLRIPEYPDEPAYLDFKLQWKSANEVNVYMLDDYNGYEEEALLGLFVRS